MSWTETIGPRTYRFADLKTLLAKASPLRSGDQLAGVAAASEEERVAAKMALAAVPLKAFLSEALVPYEEDEVTRLIVDDHEAAAFAAVAHLTVGDFRDWLLSGAATTEALERLAPGLTPEMVAAVSKLMRNQDLIAVAKKRPVVTRFRNTVGLPGRMSVRLQPNHPTDDVKGIAASMLDGLMYGCGDAMIGINPATDSLAAIVKLLAMIDGFRERYPGVEAVPQLYTFGRGRMTCAGATAILDMMLRWIAQQSDQRLADEVAQHLLISRQRPPTQEQGTPDTDKEAVANQAVAKALALMQDSLEEPLSCEALAAAVDLSPRQLQRHFQRHLGSTVMRHYLMLRLSKAHKLLQQTDLSVTEVAVGSGFTSLEHFSRVYRQTFGRSPSADRQQSTSAPVLRRPRASSH